VICGLWTALAWLVWAGLLTITITIIGIPFGIQAFTLAGLGLAPFGKKIVETRTMAAAAPRR